MTPYTWAEKFESFERINSIRETNGNFDSCDSCKRLETSRLHELHESKFPFVSRIEFIRCKLSNFSAHVYGDNVWHISWQSEAGSTHLSDGLSRLDQRYRVGSAVFPPSVQSRSDVHCPATQESSASCGGHCGVGVLSAAEQGAADRVWCRRLADMLSGPRIHEQKNYKV